MGKVKNKQSQSPKPSPIIQHDAFISKNKKRKEKRNLQKLTAKQTETGDFLPVKKNALKPLQLTGLSKKPQLSTSLPIKGKKKNKRENANHSIATSAAFSNPANVKKAGILSNPNTPKRNKNERVKFDDSVKKGEEPFDDKLVNLLGKKSQKNKPLVGLNGIGKTNTKKFFDDEADEGEEPIDDKVVKPYEKKSLKRKQMTESSDESEEDDDGSVDAEDFFDFEASEGEETDEEGDDSEADDSDESDSNEDTENTYLSNFINDDDDDDEDESDENDESEDDEEDDDESEDDDEPTLKKKEIITPSKAKQKSINLEPPAKTPTKVSESPKGKVKDVSSESSSNVTSITPSKAKGKNVNLETSVKEAEKQVTKTDVEPEKKKKDQKKKNKSEDVKVDTVPGTEKTNEKLERPSNFVGFIRKLPANVSEKDIKSSLSRVLEKDKLLKVMFAKNRRDRSQNAFIYVKDAKSLGDLIHEKFDIAGSLCPVYRARSSAVEESPPSPPEPVAFLPRVPRWITEEDLKTAVEKVIGAGKVTQLKEKRFIKSLQTRNILMSFVNADALRDAISKGDFKIKNHTVILREASEGIQVPVHRAVFSNIPEGTDEATLKKTIESTIGKNTVVNIRFSFRKNTYAFVIFKDEETVKKALALGDNISLKGTKLRVKPYVPRKPRKRAPANEHAKAKQAEKKKRKLKATGDGQQKSDSSKPNPKKQKLENGSANVPKKQNKSEQRQSNAKKPKLEDDSSNIPTTSNPPNKQTPSKPNKQKKAKQQQTVNEKKQDNNLPSTPNTPNSPSKRKKNKNKPKKSSIASPTGEVKATKNPKIKQKQKGKQSFSLSPAKDKKISPLKDKIQAKKDKLQGKKQQQKKKMKPKQST